MKQLLSTIIFLFAVILKGNAESYSFPSPNEINSVINLDLKGIFSSTHTKSLPLTPVEASLVDNTLLNISFVVHSGEVTVRILSEKGILYSSCINSDQQNSLAISVEDFERGDYKLELTTPAGGYVYGWFTINWE